ncbi:TRAP transporter small permease, partial [Dysosmobacter welbionis]
APLGDAEVGIPGGRGQDASPVLGGGVDAAQVAGPQARGPHHLVDGGADIAVAAGAQNAVHLRQLVQNVLLVPLGHAAGDQDLLYLVGPLQLRHLQNVVDGLLAGGLQEAAGVHHHHVGPLRLRLDGVAGGLDRGHHLLAVHLILGAAQGDKGNVVWHDRVLQSMDCCK